MPDVGTNAPQIDLLDQNGEQVALSSLTGRKVLVYFYPRIATPDFDTGF